MKRIFSIYSLLSVVIFSASCNKSVLEQYPTAAIAPQTFFTTENDLIAYTNSFYLNLPTAVEIYGEDFDNIVKSSVSAEISGIRNVPTTDGNRWNWGPLRNINFFLNNTNVLNFPNAEARNHYIGVARFFRAFFYFDKVKNYGDVPWYSVVVETNDVENLMKARDPRTLVMDSVLADLDFAIAHLRTTKSVERVTKWTALALKSKIGLYEGTWRKYHTEFNLPDAEKFLNECVSASEELMVSGYKVYTDTTGPSRKPYQDLFAHPRLDPVASEVILGRRFSAELGLRHNLQFYITARTQGKPGLEKRLVNSYLMTDGSRFTDKAGYDTMQYVTEIENRDPRLAQTIRVPNYRRIGATTASSIDFYATVTGYQPIKWMSTTNMDGSSQSFQDLLIFRFGEVLLNFAEAKAELGTLTQADIDRSIKLLRERVDMPNLNMAEANANPDPYQAAFYKNLTGPNRGVILEIRRERRIELVMENRNRWDDLMRWKEGHLLATPFKGMYFPSTGMYDLDGNGVPEIMIYAGEPPTVEGPYLLPVNELDEGTKGNIVTNMNIVKTFREDRDYLFPLPIEDLTLNPNLTQNPNWTR